LFSSTGDGESSLGLDRARTTIVGCPMAYNGNKY
jgi:hypothetical protein